MIDNIFNLIINKDEKIPKEFYECLEKLELNYTAEILEKLNMKNNQMLKDIIFTLYEIYNSSFKYIMPKIKRQSLINIYNICKDIQDINGISDFIAYYKKSIINKYKE